MREQINSRLNKVSPSYAEVASAKLKNCQALNNNDNDWRNPNEFPALEPSGGKNMECFFEIKNITANIQKSIETKLNTVIKGITDSISLLTSTIITALKKLNSDKKRSKLWKFSSRKSLKIFQP